MIGKFNKMKASMFEGAPGSSYPLPLETIGISSTALDRASALARPEFEALARRPRLLALADQFPSPIDLEMLDGDDGFRIEGIASDDVSGFAVSSAGDINGDGLDDMLIGAPLAQGGGDIDSGEAYVVFGRTGGFGAAFSLADLDGANGFRINGVDNFDYSGRAVSSAGDVNGDGFDDLIIGAPQDRFSYDAGLSYVVFGAAAGFDGDLDLADLDGANGFRIEGVQEYNETGFAVAGAGDFNGDGFDDMIVGAPGFTSGDGNGAAYVIFGKPGAFNADLDLASIDGDNGVRLDGFELDVGRSVSFAGDVNADGLGDIILGAPGLYTGGTGASYVVFGRADESGASFDLADLDGANGFVIPGLDDVDRSGRSVAGAGDVNGDGFDDILVGAPQGDPHGADEGEIYVVFGSGDGFAASLDLNSLDGSNGFRLDGVEDNAYNGYSVSSAGDVNGDGFDDILIGAPDSDVNGANGRSFVMFGRASGFEASMDLLFDGSDGFIMTSGQPGAMSGHSVSSAGDANGDGFADIIIGAPYANVGDVAAAGKSYVVFGRKPGEAVDRIGSGGDQAIFGGSFDDSLAGLGGADTLFGLGGHDLLTGGEGADALIGGGGIDRADYGDAASKVLVDLAISSRNTGDAAGDRYRSIEELGGSSRRDALFGDAGDNRIEGIGGQDLLGGRQGDDSLAGGAGYDRLKGGVGHDRFELASLKEAHADRIIDFASGSDEIALAADVFEITHVEADEFVIGPRALDADDRLIYDDATGKLFFDGDGSGAGAQVQIARFSGLPTIEATDFVVI